MGKHGFKSEKKEEKSRVTVAETIAEDIERLVDLAERNATEGGIFDVSTWDEDITETLKKVFEDRFRGKGACQIPGTFDAEYSMCTKECKIKKACAFWTKFFQEAEEDATTELAEYQESEENRQAIENAMEAV